jgi:hypothetical protein
MRSECYFPATQTSDVLFLRCVKILFLDEAWRSEETVMIHCREGRNRSAALLLAWLMGSSTLGGYQRECVQHTERDLLKNRSLKEMLAYVKNYRALVDPNIGFLKQLLDFERSLSCGMKNFI